VSEFVKILLTSGLTIVGGVSVLVIGQILSKFFIEAIYEQRKSIGAVADVLIFSYDLVIKSPLAGEERKEASDALRRCATELVARTHAVPWYSLWERLKFVRPETNIVEACNNLVELSRSFAYSTITPEITPGKIREILEALNIKILLGK
jgi:hypothetical protein